MDEIKLKELVREVFRPIVQEVINEQMKTDNSTIKNPEQLLTVKQAATESGLTENMIRKAMSEGELAYYMPKSRYLVRRSDVFAYRDSIKVRSNDEVQDYPFLKNRK